MSCPTCDHTMQGLGSVWFWCPRCGTVKTQGLSRKDSKQDTPSLVARLKEIMEVLK